MRSKLHRRVEIINYITQQNFFKGIYFLALLLALYGGAILGAGTQTIIDNLMVTFSFPIFNILVIVLLTLNTYYVYYMFSHEFDFYLIRMRTKKEAYKETVRIVVFSNLFLILLFMILLFIFLIFFKAGNFGKLEYFVYRNVEDWIYILFYLLRYFLIIIIFSKIDVLLLNRRRHELSIILTVVLCCLILSNKTDLTKIYHFSLAPWSYFDMRRYTNFFIEVCNSVLYLFILETIILVLNFILMKKRKKYEVHNFK